MFHRRNSSRHTWVQLARAIALRLCPGVVTLLLLALLACGDSSGPGGDGGSASLAGTVRAASGAAALQGATISVGTKQATSDATGHFELTGLSTGSSTVTAERPGYLMAQATVTIGAGTNTHDFALADQEIYLSGANAVYVPAGVGPMRGVIITLGGPVTSGFVTGDPIAPPNSPELEASLQSLGASLRSLAKASRVALFGSSVTLTNSAATDDALFAALNNVAASSGHPEIGTAPVLPFGLSAGAREASGLAARRPDRMIGLLLRVPADASSVTTPAALAVPTFVMQAELDVTVNNGAVQAIFLGNRSRGALWSLAVEPGVDHHTASSLGNLTSTSWITAVLSLRLPATPGGALVALDETGGWLGDQATLNIAPWASFPGNPAVASWLLNQSAASSWKALGTIPGGGGG